jgi:hypothetical protein
LLIARSVGSAVTGLTRERIPKRKEETTMRRHYKTLAMAVGFIAVLAGAAIAGQATPSTTGDKQALVEARKELTARAAETKGAPRAHYDLERRHVDRLIGALESGQRVSPEEVEDAVGDARKAPF